MKSALIPIVRNQQSERYNFIKTCKNIFIGGTGGPLKTVNLLLQKFQSDRNESGFGNYYQITITNESP